jgi:hypothetical protein
MMQAIKSRINYNAENWLLIQMRQSVSSDQATRACVLLIPRERRLFYEHVPVYYNHTDPQWFSYSILGAPIDSPSDDERRGYFPWFSVFLDSDGYCYSVYYREKTHKHGMASYFVLDIAGKRLTCGYWVHRQYGLTDLIMPKIIADFASLFWFEIEAERAARGPGRT